MFFSLAEKGIKLVQEGQYSQAVSMFTEAIKCDPKDYRYITHDPYLLIKSIETFQTRVTTLCFYFSKLTSRRFFGNRSYCYYCLEQYPQALADAERSIQLAPDWPKGHFRKGSALMGMKVGIILKEIVT